MVSRSQRLPLASDIIKVYIIAQPTKVSTEAPARPSGVQKSPLIFHMLNLVTVNPYSPTGTAPSKFAVAPNKGVATDKFDKPAYMCSVILQ